jgi:hypothetical protein
MAIVQACVPVPELPDDVKKRVGHLKDRDDLFATRFLDVATPGVLAAHILILGRDPGSASAILPVARSLADSRTVNVSLLCDGRAYEAFRQAFPQAREPAQASYEDWLKQVAGRSWDVVVAVSSVSEHGIETYAAATLDEAPMVLVEDNYGMHHGLLAKLRARKLRLPAAICVIDEVSKRRTIERFPELQGRLHVTGQPSFDRLVAEDRSPEVMTAIRKDLGLWQDEDLVTFMITTDILPVARALAQALAKTSTPRRFKVALGHHPRDRKPYEAYEAAFREAGVGLVEMRGKDALKAALAADVVVTTWSTEGLVAVLRGKPTIYLQDPEFLKPKEDTVLPMPPVSLGAARGLGNIKEVSRVLPPLLVPTSAENGDLRRHMWTHYPQDGRNTERVLRIVRHVIGENM